MKVVAIEKIKNIFTRNTNRIILIKECQSGCGNIIIINNKIIDYKTYA